MEISITDFKIYGVDQRNTDYTDFLIGNVFKKVRSEIAFTVSIYTLASTGNELILNNTDGYLGTGWVTGNAGQFEKFNVGDVVRWGDYTANTLLGTFTILQKLSDSEIQLSGVMTGVGDDYVSNQSYFSIVVDTTALRFFWNIIENNAPTSYFSIVDGQEQQLVIEEIDASVTTPLPMKFQGAKSYQIGSAIAEGVSKGGVTIYENKFKIKHTFFINPFLLPSDYLDFTNGIAPDSLFNGNSLKYIFKIVALPEFTDPNSRFEFETDSQLLGNVGWLNENYNNKPTNYSVFSTVYKDIAATVIPNLGLTSDSQTVEFIIKNTTDTPFVNSNTKYTLNYIRIPEIASEYQLNGKTLDENFMFDRVFSTLGNTTNGDRFGTTRQVIKSVTSTFISSSEIKITATVEFGSEIISEYNLANIQRYLFAIEIQKHSLAPLNSDNVCLNGGYGELYIDNSDPTMIGIATKFLRHTEQDVNTEGFPTITMFPEDEVVAYSQFFVDKATRLTDTIQLISATGNLKMTNTITGESFTLDTFSVNMANSIVVNGNQQLSFEQTRGFHLPANEFRKYVRLNRRTDLDNSNKYYYEFQLPFLYRWEYWKPLISANTAFFDNAQPNNGLNNFWHRYATFANWELSYSIEIKAKKNGNLLSYKDTKALTSTNYNSNSNWTTESIKTYDIDTNTELFDNINNKRFIQGYKNTKVVALFKSSSSPILLSNYQVVLGIEPFEGGGILERRRMSSLLPSDSDTWFKSIDLSNEVVLTQVGADTVRAEVLTDFSKIPASIGKFKITARLYDLSAPSTGKIFQNGNLFLFQNGNNYLFQNQ